VNETNSPFVSIHAAIYRKKIMENTEIIKTKKNQWMKKFIPIWSAQLFSLLGSSLVQFALVWYLTEKTGSATILTLATMMAIIPEILFAPIAGALVDRWNRRIVMIVSDGSTAFFTLILAVLFALGKVQTWHIFVVIFLRACGGIFQWPAMSASTALMVPEEHLSRVAGINQAIRGSLNIVAPPLGALLMSLLPFYQVISVDIVTALIAITPLFFIKIPQPIRVGNDTQIGLKNVFGDVLEGFRYMKAWPGLMILTAGAAFCNFVLAPCDTLLPLMVTRYFGKGVWELSLMQSALGIGIIIGGLVLGVWGGFKNRVVTSMLGVMGIGLGVFLVGIAPSSLFWMAVVGFAVCGFMNPIANGPQMAILQSRVPPEMQGRVMSFVTSFCMAMMPLGLLIATPVVEKTSISTWFWVSGILTILMGIVGLMLPQVVGLEAARSTTQDAVVSVE
jgi:DHA3 family macrolide efflux protein-like MFS transporter